VLCLQGTDGLLDSNVIDALREISCATSFFCNPLAHARKKKVLVLGNESHEKSKKRIREISKILKNQGYEPMVIMDLPEIPEFSNEEKVRVYADQARFVIVENTYPGGQLTECKVCAINRIVTAIICKRGQYRKKRGSYMVADYKVDFNYLNADFVYDYDDEITNEREKLQSLEQQVKKIIRWAEKLIEERIEYYNDIYPWRKRAKKDLEYQLQEVVQT